MTPATSTRYPGLDTLRALAIVLVLMYHYMVVVSNESTFGFLTDIGWMGVDLFFVLSGYLIGHQVLGGVARGHWNLATFFARRLLRTVPAYLVVLAAYLVFPALAGRATAPWWRFLTFTQNLGLRPGETFSHSWSLCVEEQFYLVLPAAALLLARLGARGRGWWMLLAAGVGTAIAVRVHAWQAHDALEMTGIDYYQHIYYNTWARFDELLAGVAVAVLRVWHPRAYAALLAAGNRLLAAGVAATALMWWWLDTHLQVDGIGYPLAPTAIGYPLLAAAYALLVLAALSPGSLLNRVRVPGARRIALWSYSIYLAHKPVSLVLVKPVQGWGIDPRGTPGVALIMAASVLAGWLLYRAAELPFLRLRERWLGRGATDAAQRA